MLWRLPSGKKQPFERKRGIGFLCRESVPAEMPCISQPWFFFFAAKNDYSLGENHLPEERKIAKSWHLW